MESNRESISIGICAHNEEDTIGTLLEQLMKEDIPIKEVIVVVAGSDGTSQIVKAKGEKYEEIFLIEEESREGQTRAQNKFLEKAEGDSLLFLDGDGTIEENSLENLYRDFTGSNAVSGKEVPVTEDSFVGSVIEAHAELHHKLCMQSPRFSTNIGLIPSRNIEKFPDLLLDDIYLEHIAIEKENGIEYISDAVKLHSTPNNLRFFFHQQKKNWLGRMEGEKRGFKHSKKETKMIQIFTGTLIEKRGKNIISMTALAAIELAAYLSARFQCLTDNFSEMWKRPGKNLGKEN